MSDSSIQVPLGPKGRICPFHQRSMHKVCHKCPLWTLVRGSNPQTGKEVDQWDCGLAHIPMLLIETSKTTRGVQAATESFRNAMVDATRNQLLNEERKWRQVEGEAKPVPQIEAKEES